MGKKKQILSSKPSPLSYGAFVNTNTTTFKIHAPRSTRVHLVIFKFPNDETGVEHGMTKQDNGDFIIALNDTGVGTIYGFRLEGQFNDPGLIIADPYSKAAITQNSMRPVAKSLVVDDTYDWEDDTWIHIDPRDLIIYEMHVRDMTAHPTSTTCQKGTYAGLVEAGQNGGIEHIQYMGVNAVQILPIQDFANFEVPFKDNKAPLYNDWNPYERNHWGYMTTFFFAPESYYASDGTDIPGSWNGIDGRSIDEIKDMVKAFHKKDIAVIMDVVYNHVSNYDWNPLKYIDREMYFRLDENDDYIAHSGCGNDTRSEHPKMQQLILESLKYWMIEYHVDGFRFDLAHLIDAETREMIIKELRTINPHVIILAEPWGNGYDPDGFSDMGWASFNDQLRDGLKGNVIDVHEKGFLFGCFRGEEDQTYLQSYVMGSLRQSGGQYLKTAHSVNYLECHDNYTFGDRVRITGGFMNESEKINNVKDNALVQGKQLAINKLGALFLFTCQGITFIHEGQEWARSKVVAETTVPDKHIGLIDHNSYEKDNETNWLNWNEREMNRELVDYYKGLIAFRKQYPEFRHSKPEDFEFMDVGEKVAVAYLLKDRFVVILNGENEDTLKFDLPEGQWNILADEKLVNLENQQLVSNKISVPPSSGIVLKRN